MIKMNNTPSSSSSGFLSATNNNMSTSGSESDYGAMDYNTSHHLNNNIPPKEDDTSFVEDLLRQADSDNLIIKTEVFQSLSDNDQSPAPPTALTPHGYGNDPTVFAPPTYHSFNSFPQVRNNSQFTGYVQNHHAMAMDMNGYQDDFQSQQPPPPPHENYWYQHPMKPPLNSIPPVQHHHPSFMFPTPGQGPRPASSFYLPSHQQKQQQQMAEMLHFSNR